MARKKSSSTYQRILEAAVRLYGERGPDAVGMRELAREVGVLPNTITYHFGSKLNLCRRALTHALENGIPMDAVLARHVRDDFPDDQTRADHLAAVISDLATEVTDARFEPYARMITQGILGIDTEQKRLLLEGFNNLEVNFIALLESMGINLDETGLRFFTYYLWSQLLFLSASQDMMRVDLGVDTLPPEFMEAFIHEIARMCCLSIGLPRPRF